MLRSFARAESEGVAVFAILAGVAGVAILASRGGEPPDMTESPDEAARPSGIEDNQVGGGDSGGTG